MGETARLCSDIVDRCEKGLQAFDGVSAPQIVQDEYVALPVRLALLFIFGGYFAYAWRIGGVREAIGMGGMQVHSMLDIIQRIISTILLGLFGYVAVTGERIGTAGE